MTLDQAIRTTYKAIDHIYDPSEAQNVSRYYFEDKIGLSSLESVLTSDQEAAWQADLPRLAEGEPLQYVVGGAHFYGHAFMVNDSVLIPRPETEELVRQCIQLCKTYDRPIRILDVGTGSGCIPISVKKALPSATMVTSIDISKAAILLAIDNSQLLDAHVKFKIMDVTDGDATTDLGIYDIIISNPPYIPQREKNLMPVWVKDHEPEIALFVEDDAPLYFYDRILDLATDHLAEDGHILFEVNEYNASEVKQLAQHKMNAIDAEILTDLQSKDRIVSISKVV